MSENKKASVMWLKIVLPHLGKSQSRLVMVLKVNFKDLISPVFYIASTWQFLISPKIAGTLDKPGAEERSRTSDLLITNQLLYQLSYFGKLIRPLFYHSIWQSATFFCRSVIDYL